MKKGILVISLIIVLSLGLFILTGCGNKENEVTNNTQTIQKNESATNTEVSDVNKTTNSEHEYTYKDGVLTQIVDEDGNPTQTDFVIDGIILVGNRHDYERDDSMEIIESFAKKGYKKEDINKSSDNGFMNIRSFRETDCLAAESLYASS